MDIWWVAIPALLLLVAFANARYYQKQGYKFWLTFLFSLLMLFGICAIFLKAFKVI